MGQGSLFVPYAAYLRVYEPLAAFPLQERGHWSAYAESGHRPTAQDELRRSLGDLLPTPPVAVPVHESRDAFVLENDGVTCVCPWRTRLRGWQALESLPELLPAPVLDAVLPPVVRRQAAADYERWIDDNPDARPWIRTATWHVPVRWFALFSDEEREYVPGPGAGSPEAGRLPEAGGGPETGGGPEAAAGDGGAEADGGAGTGPGAGAGADADGEAVGTDGDAAGGEPVLRYRTPMVEARRRVARGLKVLRDALEESPLIDGLENVGRWLEEFHPRSLVELDYGGLVHTLGHDQLSEDHSAADVAEGLEALRGGDPAKAGEVYQRLVERWRAVRERQFAN
ncbi:MULTISPECIES: hypothetical protein [Streptomyces]|uniref:DUF8083 domain-containing protein n=1 Tax=Streptomyces lycii TaxID=2654337 RepID=A0ABQ7FAB7_9ACTN|nr:MULTISPECIES: hypothetical protein [Streptomyces]KAF4405155.1 hypothetical protein GCU69_31810 [Streptomyces lycii]PGH49233.1 hypothetical protein CRI70_18845 [Streptomyces sp. Ru87]